MNSKAFVAMLLRDWRVARRNFAFLLVQTMLQPMLFVFIFGRVLTRSGFMPPEYKSLLLPGIIAIAMMFSGIMGVAMPLIGEFQYTREIEDRLLAPIAIEWVAIEKIVAGAIQALVSGLVVVPAAWLVMGSGVDISFHAPLTFLGFAMLVSLLAASIGLALGCFISQTTIGLMFSLFVTPMIMFGSTYYPWSALAVYPWLQKAVLINPLVYASEGFRAALVPQFPHLPLWIDTLAMATFVAIFLTVGLRLFRKKAIA
jgi:ABC-2 type transport system permease protein